MIRLVFFLALCPLLLKSQPELADSLRRLLATAKNDSARCAILSQLVDAEYDDKVWPVYNAQLEQLCGKYLKNVPVAKGKLDTLFVSWACIACNNRGYLLQSQGNIRSAIEAFNKSVEYAGRISDKINLSMTYNNLGGIYADQKMYTEALKYFKQSLQIRLEIGDSVGIGQSYLNLASVYDETGQIDKCLDFTYKSIRLCSKQKEMARLALLYNNLATIKRTRKQYREALDLYQRVIRINDSLGNKRGLCVVYGNIADLHLGNGDLDLAKQYGLKAYELSAALGFPVHIQTHASILYNVERASKNWQNALNYYLIYSRMKDSLENIESKKAAITQEIKFEYERKKDIEEVNHQKELAISAERENKQRVVIIAIAGGLLLVLGFAAFVMNRLRLTSRQKKIIAQQKHLVEEKQREIVDSINYAKRIQQASMASEKYIARMFRDLREK